MVQKSNIPLRIGIAGLGTVGIGVFKILTKKAKLISKRAGREVVIQAISARSKEKERGINFGKIQWYDNPEHLASDPNVDVVVELIGGADGVAHDLATTAFKNEKHLVTANKALIATYGLKLAKLAEKNNKALCFEAAVAGGIPVIKTMKEGLSANKIKSICGILNGTCNYILTEMAKTRSEFDEILKQAQDKGYAEADPTFDIDGTDTAHKTSILAALAFGCAPELTSVYIEGIDKITLDDIDYATELGYKIKLLGFAEISEDEKSYIQSAYPCLVQKSDALSEVNGVLNAIKVSTDSLGELFMSGAGAGEQPTASSVVADIVDIARGYFNTAFGTATTELTKLKPKKISEHEGSYYIRLKVSDKPGVIASVTSALEKNHISIASLLQKAQKNGSDAQIAIITHKAVENSVINAIDSIGKVEYVLEPPHMIRVMDHG